MIDAAEALRVIGEAEEQLAGPLLDRREENRVIFVPEPIRESRPDHLLDHAKA